MDTIQIKIIPTYIFSIEFKDDVVNEDKTLTTILDNNKIKRQC